MIIIINMICDNQIYMISLDCTRVKTSEAFRELPDAEDKVPDAEDKVPDAEDKVPDAEDKVPDAEDKVPDAEDKVPDAEDKVKIKNIMRASQPCNLENNTVGIFAFNDRNSLNVESIPA
jgi:archaellum component FlaD/FlaE